MKHVFAVLAASAAVGIASSAYAADESAQAKSTMDYKDNGGYKSSATAQDTSTNGTTTTQDKSVDVDVDSKGNVDKTVKSSQTTDPKGLLNKKANKTKTTYVEKSNGGYKQTTVRKHTDANGTDTYYKTITNVDVDKDGKVTSTVTSEQITDPKGLFNETKTKTKVKKVDGQVVEHTQSN